MPEPFSNDDGTRLDADEHTVHFALFKEALSRAGLSRCLMFPFKDGRVGVPHRSLHGKRANLVAEHFEELKKTLGTTQDPKWISL